MALLSLLIASLVIANNNVFQGVLAQTDPESFDWTSLTPADALDWVSCYSVFQCSRLNVPIDYSQPAGDKAAIAIIRLRSQLSPSDSAFGGPVLFNPGGPGSSGIDVMVSRGQELAAMVGPQFDLVTFDPRGISHSTPTVFFVRGDAESSFWDSSANSGDMNATLPSIDIPRLWAKSQVLGHLAKDRDNGMLAHITTDNVARDMLKIVEAYNETKLQYYGVSYGSVLGATFATLFPDRVGRIIIDGVLDMESYFSSDYRNELLDTDKVLQTFFDGCYKAGPKACAYYASSPFKIHKNLNALLDSVRSQPVPVYSKSTSNYGVIDYATLKSAVLQALYTPYASFQSLAQAMADLKNGDGSTLFDFLGGTSQFGAQCNLTSDGNELDSGIAISCGDTINFHDTAVQLEKYYQKSVQVSNFVDMIPVPQRVRCSGWQVRPKTPFTGPVKGKTSFPILLIANTADPATPLAGAAKTSKAFPGSIVLVQDSPGHTSLAATSYCTLGYIREYFVNGTLPKKGTVCSVDQELFPSSSNTTTREIAGNLLGSIPETIARSSLVGRRGFFF